LVERLPQERIEEPSFVRNNAPPPRSLVLNKAENPRGTKRKTIKAEDSVSLPAIRVIFPKLIQMLKLYKKILTHQKLNEKAKHI
jgi:hypothetical protein